MYNNVLVKSALYMGGEEDNGRYFHFVATTHEGGTFADPQPLDQTNKSGKLSQMTRIMSKGGRHEKVAISLYTALFLCFIVLLPSSNAQRTWYSHENTWGQEKYLHMECPDTLINDTLWTPIRTALYSPFEDTLYCGYRSGYTRSEDGQVYFRDLWRNETRIIYDYGMDIGDTIFLKPDIWQADFVLTQIDTIYLLGKERRRLHLEMLGYDEFDVWIEGIGSIENDYLQSGEPEHQITDAGTIFVCFQEHPTDSIYHRYPTWPICLIDSLDCPCGQLSSIHQQDATIRTKIFPNPATDQLTIESDVVVDILILYNSLGQIVHISSLNSRKHMLHLEVLNLSPGTYFVQVVSGRRQEIIRIVIQ